MSKTNFFVSKNYEQLVARLENITPAATRRWGRMNASQMLHHLNVAIGSGLGYYQLPDTSHLVGRTLVRFLLIDVIPRFPKGTNAPATLRAISSYDFETEKKQLKEILAKGYVTKTDDEWGRHTYFGKMTRKAWGKLIMKHCDHHFRQFSN